MNGRIVIVAAFVTATCLVSACAGMQRAISMPGVSLRNVEVADVSFSDQTFLLTFDVTNPNSFPLPVNYVIYGVTLDDKRFASGQTVTSFTVPAQSDAEFAISVELDLFRTAPQLLFIVRDGTMRDLPYELSGKLGIDIPFVEPVSFKSSGEIRFLAHEFQGRNSNP